MLEKAGRVCCGVRTSFEIHYTVRREVLKSEGEGSTSAEALYGKIAVLRVHVFIDTADVLVEVLSDSGKTLAICTTDAEPVDLLRR